MFYHGQGNECGGLVFGADTGPVGRQSQGLSLSFDAFGLCQVAQPFRQDLERERRYGLRPTDRPARPLSRDLAAMREAQGLSPGPERDAGLAAADGHAHRVLR